MKVSQAAGSWTRFLIALTALLGVVWIIWSGIAAQLENRDLRSQNGVLISQGRSLIDRNRDLLNQNAISTEDQNYNLHIFLDYMAAQALHEARIDAYLTKLHVRIPASLLEPVRVPTLRAVTPPSGSTPTKKPPGTSTPPQSKHPPKARAPQGAKKGHHRHHREGRKSP